MEVDSTYVQQMRAQHDYLWEIAYEKETNSNIDLNPDVDTSGFMQFISIIVFVVLAALIVWAVVRWLNRLQPADAIDDEPQGMGDDTIYNHKWDKEIAAAMENKEYDLVAVLCYLYFLKRLNMAKVIAFSQSKTPGIFQDEAERYVTAKAQQTPGAEPEAQENAQAQPREQAEPSIADDSELVGKLRELTNAYLLVRYGHRHVSEDRVNQLLKLARS